MPVQPVVILGGFLITAEAYGPMCLWLRQRSRQPLRLVAHRERPGLPAAVGSHRDAGGGDGGCLTHRQGHPDRLQLRRLDAAAVLPGVPHGGAFGTRWYGTPVVVAQWWCD